MYFNQSYFFLYILYDLWDDIIQIYFIAIFLGIRYNEISSCKEMRLLDHVRHQNPEK